MSIIDPGEKYRDGLPTTPGPYVQWGIVDDVIDVPTTYPIYDHISGQKIKDIPIRYARSCAVTLLDGQGRLTGVRYLEPLGNTAMPMRGAVCAIGTLGKAGGEPIILGFITSGYQERSDSLEFGAHMSQGNEILRRSGIRWRIVPQYTDLRQFNNQYIKSTWDIDIRIGEQSDDACWCPQCQARFAKEGNSCPTICSVCGGGPLRAIQNSIAAPYADTFVTFQVEMVLSTILNELYKGISESLVANTKDITNPYLLAVITGVRQEFISWSDLNIKNTLRQNIKNFYNGSIQNYYTEIISNFAKYGDLSTYTALAPDFIAALITPIVEAVDMWLSSSFVQYLSGTMDEDVRIRLSKAMRASMADYISNIIPMMIRNYITDFVSRKIQYYITEKLDDLKRRATSATDNITKEVYTRAKTFLVKEAKSLVSSAFKKIVSEKKVDPYAARYTDYNASPEELRLNQLRDMSDAGKVVTVPDLEWELKKIDFVNLLKQFKADLATGLKDPEDLPIFEIILSKDSTIVVNDTTGYPEGTGAKTPAWRFRVYRDGSVKLQVTDKASIGVNSEGDMSISNTSIDITTERLNVQLFNDSSIDVDTTLYLGNTEVEMKKLTLDQDKVEEIDTTRDYIQKVAWSYISEKLASMFTQSAVTPSDGGATLKSNMAISLGIASLTERLMLLPNTQIGKVIASSAHIKAN